MEKNTATMIKEPPYTRKGEKTQRFYDMGRIVAHDPELPCGKTYRRTTQTSQPQSETS